MSLKIRRQLVDNLRYSYGRGNTKRYITIHETANTRAGADAQAHANLQSRGFSSSFHWQVDDKEAIQSYDHGVQCWHAGDGRGAGNTQSIAIEICVNSDGDFTQAVENAAALTAKIMAEENIPIENVVQHNRWSGKNCPTYLRNGSKGIRWSDFIAMVNGEEAEVKTTKPSKPKVKSKKISQKAKSYLSIGDKGEAVRVMQSKLNALGYDLGRWGADGDFGRQTDKALRQFQADYGLLVDGKYGTQSKRALESAKPAPKSNGYKANLVVDGYLGKQTISALQRYFGTPVDGIISKPRSVVVIALQKWLGVKADGIWGAHTTRALQKRFGTPVDGVISKPSVVIRELQRRLNKGKL